MSCRPRAATTRLLTELLKAIDRGLGSSLYNTLMNVVSLWIFTSESFVECPVLERLSRAPSDPPRPRDRATSAPHGTRSNRRKNRPQRQPRLAGSVERSRPRSPIWRGIVKIWKSRYDAVQHNLCIHELTYCCCTRAAISY